MHKACSDIGYRMRGCHKRKLSPKQTIDLFILCEILSVCDVKKVNGI